MNCRLFFVLTVFGAFVGAGVAQADDGPVYDVAKFRRWRSSHCYSYRSPVVYSRPHYSSATAVSQTVISNSFNNNYGRPVYSGYGGIGASARAGVGYAGAFVGPGIAAPWNAVAPAADCMTPGRTYTLRLNYLGDKGGDVVIFIGGTSHNCIIRSWTPSEVVFEVPNMGVAHCGSTGELVVTRCDGVTIETKPIHLVNSPSLIEHEELPPGQPANQVGMGPFGGSLLQAVGG